MTIKRITRIQSVLTLEEHSYDASDFKLSKTQKVIIETSDGLAIGRIVVEPYTEDIPDTEIKTLLKVVRPFTIEDLEREQILIQRAREAKIYCQDKAREMNLDMTIIEGRFNFDGSNIILYFVAESRVDFRDLIKDLAKRFHTHIEMKQIGARDRAKMLGGMGSCGRELCCSTFLKGFTSVTIKHVRPQGLPLVPQKLSGVCGKLMCCLTYEYDFYVHAIENLPKLNKKVSTTLGNGEVIGYDVFKMEVIVKLENGEQVKLKNEEVKSKSLFL